MADNKELEAKMDELIEEVKATKKILSLIASEICDIDTMELENE